MHLTQEEWQLYQRMHLQARAEFQRYAASGAGHVRQSLPGILWLLAPLRRICAGGPLCEWAAPRLGFRGGLPGNACDPGEECPGCLEAMEQPVLLPCAHWACRRGLLHAPSLDLSLQHANTAADVHALHRECATAQRRCKCPLCGAVTGPERLREGLPVLKSGTSLVSECKLRALLQQVSTQAAMIPAGTSAHACPQRKLEVQ